jgi:hypothetical protein
LFLLQLSHFKNWLMRGPTDAERSRIWRALAGMHWPVCVSCEHGFPVAVRWHDCGFAQPSLCLLLDEPTTRFEYARPEDCRDPMPGDGRFLRACGVCPPDVRGELRVLDRRPEERSVRNVCW